MANISISSVGQEFNSAHSYPEPIRIVLIVLGVAYTVIGLPGNVLTVIAIVRQKLLRTRLNAFIVNLCITDILAVGYLYPFITSDLILDYHPVPLLWCQLNTNLLHALAGASFITTQSIAISRYVKVCRENLFEKLFSKTNTVVFCFVAWAPGIAMAAMNIPNLGPMQYEKVARICFVGIGKFNIAKGVLNVLFPLSYVCTMYCYVRVWQTLRKHDLAIRSSGNEAFSRMRYDSNRRQTSMSFLLGLFYICLTLPMLIVFTSGIQCHPYVYGVALSLYFSNSPVNCIVYGALHRGVRRFYLSQLPGGWKVKIQPASES